METQFDELLDFPCNFSFKVVGNADDSLVERIVTVAQKHAPGDYSPSVKKSSKGTYHSVTINVTVIDKNHVETLYVAFGDIDGVLRVL